MDSGCRNSCSLMPMALEALESAGAHGKLTLASAESLGSSLVFSLFFCFFWEKLTMMETYPWCTLIICASKLGFMKCFMLFLMFELQKDLSLGKSAGWLDGLSGHNLRHPAAFFAGISCKLLSQAVRKKKGQSCECLAMPPSSTLTIHRIFAEKCNRGTLWWTNMLRTGKSPCLMGKSTISMAIFNCYVSSPEGMLRLSVCDHLAAYPA